MERRARPRPRAAARARGRRTRGEALRAQGAGARRAEGGGPRVLFAAGGTGGHVYPAIAIADAVRRLDPRAEVGRRAGGTPAPTNAGKKTQPRRDGEDD